MHWSIPYIGTPWAATAEGPDAFHCWSFFRHVQAHHFNIDVPPIPNPDELLPIARQFNRHPELAHWRKTDKPGDGDAVLLTTARVPVHIGVWLDADGGGILHCCEEHGVAFQTRQALNLNNWRIHNFYRHVSRL